jgi:hypothetical protein
MKATAATTRAMWVAPRNRAIATGDRHHAGWASTAHPFVWEGVAGRGAGKRDKCHTFDVARLQQINMNLK